MNVKTTKEIQRQLRALNNPWACAAVAARLAVRMLPTLSRGMAEDKAFLEFCPEERRHHHLLATLRASAGVWIAAFYQDKQVADATYATYATIVTPVRTAHTDTPAYGTANVNTYVATQAAYDAAHYFRAVRARAAVDATNAAFAAVCTVIHMYGDDIDTFAAHAAAAKAELTEEIQDYIHFFNENPSITEFLEAAFKPLASLQAAETSFLQALRDLGDDFDIWADWYEARVAGQPLDQDIALQMAILPAEIKDQAPTKINAYIKSL